ncbi:MAG TPA: amino acid racemase [Polyangiaceae bacterium]|nr:amino acid racemase [Polyangiaceae bacterium]
MPKITPAGGEVSWPENEGTLGVVGVAPWATLDFCRALYEAVRARKDWHFPRVLLDINTKLPSRGRHLQLGETDPSPAIAATIGELAAQGATVAVVVCNTAHILYERWAKEAPIPVLHIIDETLRAAKAHGAHRVASLVSASLARYDLYGKGAEGLSLDCVRLDDREQTIINTCIESIKVNGAVIPDSLNYDLDALFQGLVQRGVDTVIAGCTELSAVAPHAKRANLRLVDSNRALAHAVLRSLAMPAELLD